MLRGRELRDTAPWQDWFRAPITASARIASTDATRGLVVSNTQSNAFQLYAWQVPSGELRQLTFHPSGKGAGGLSPDGRFVYFLDDEQGNELGHLKRVPFEGGPLEDVSPDLPVYTLRGVGFSMNGKALAFTAVNAEGFQLFLVPIGPENRLGRPRLLHRSLKEAWGAILSSDGGIAAMISTARAGGQRHYSLLALDTTSGHVIGEVWDGPGASVEVVAFSALVGDTRILATTSRSGFKRPLIWDPLSEKRMDLTFDELEGEIIPVDWSLDGGQVLLCQIHRAHHQLYTYDLPSQTLNHLDHPSGTFYDAGIGVPGAYLGPYFVPEDEIWALWEDSAHSPQLLALNAQTGTPMRTLLSTRTPPGRPWQSVTFTSSDDQEVQGWLGVPEGQPPFPTILDMHGGPGVVTPNYFSPASQAWLAHGFAYFTINYRGSTTFGQRFKEQIWGDIGHWELEDMVAARDWLVNHGIARPDSVLLHGGSYGGYLTLWGLTKRPELWAGGVALVPGADWIASYEDANDALKGWMAGLLGGTPGERREQYVARSPITYAQDVQAPLLIIQGRRDTRAPARQIEMYEAKMKSLGKEVEVRWFDTGHLMSDKEQLIKFQEDMMLFAHRVLTKSRRGSVIP